MVRALALVVGLAAIVVPHAAHAGAWVPDPGRGYAKLWTKWLYGVGYHDGDGGTRDYGRYHELFVASYAEVGLVERLAAIWHMDLARTFYLRNAGQDDGQWHATVGDPRLGLRYALLSDQRLVMAVEASATAPLARSSGVQDFIYDDGTVAGQLKVGAGVWDLAARYAVGYGFDAWYAEGGVGYILRTGGFDDVVEFSAGAGTTLGRFGLRGRLSGHLALERGDGAEYNDSPSGIGNGVSYVGFALEGDYELARRWFLGLVFEGGLFAIRRQTGGPVVSLYGAYDF